MISCSHWGMFHQYDVWDFARDIREFGLGISDYRLAAEGQKLMWIYDPWSFRESQWSEQGEWFDCRPRDNA